MYKTYEFETAVELSGAEHLCGVIFEVYEGAVDIISVTDSYGKNRNDFNSVVLEHCCDRYLRISKHKKEFDNFITDKNESMI